MEHIIPDTDLFGDPPGRLPRHPASPLAFMTCTQLTLKGLPVSLIILSVRLFTITCKAINLIRKRVLMILTYLLGSSFLECQKWAWLVWEVFDSPPTVISGSTPVVFCCSAWEHLHHRYPSLTLRLQRRIQEFLKEGVHH